MNFCSPPACLFPSTLFPLYLTEISVIIIALIGEIRCIQLINSDVDDLSQLLLVGYVAERQYRRHAVLYWGGDVD